MVEVSVVVSGEMIVVSLSIDPNGQVSVTGGVGVSLSSTGAQSDDHVPVSGIGVVTSGKSVTPVSPETITVGGGGSQEGDDIGSEVGSGILEHLLLQVGFELCFQIYISLSISEDGIGMDVLDNISVEEVVFEDDDSVDGSNECSILGTFANIEDSRFE